MSSSVGSVFGGITRKVNDLGSSLSKLKRQSADIGRLQAAQGRLADAQSKGNAAAVARYSAQIEKLSSSLREAGVDTSRLSQEQARLASQIGRTEGQLGRMTRLSGAWSGFKSNLLNVGDAFGRVKSNVTGLATKLGVLGTAAGYLFKTQFLDTAAEFEKLQTMLTSVEKGDVNKAKASFGWISTWATETPLQLAEATSAFIKFKNYGLDPTKGGLEALEDQNAKMGGGIHELEGLIMAVGQAWTKQKLQGEEIMQMQERGVPVWDLLSATMGKSVAELQDMSKAGKLGRKEIELLLKAIGQNSKGAAKAQMKTWGGMISNLQDWWSKFTVMVMSEGLFEWMKGKLGGVLEELNRAAEDGRLQMWAEQTGAAIKEFFVNAWELGKSIRDVAVAAADFVGGWKNLGIILGAVALAPTIASVVQLGIAIGGVLGPWGLLAAAVIAAFTALYKYRDEIKAWLEQQPQWLQWLLKITNPVAMMVVYWDKTTAAIARFKDIAASAIDWVIQKIDALFAKLSSLSSMSIGGVSIGDAINLVKDYNPVSVTSRLIQTGQIMPAASMPQVSNASVKQDFQINVTAPSADPQAVGQAVKSAIKEAPLYDTTSALGPR